MLSHLIERLLIIPAENIEIFSRKIPIKYKNKNEMILLTLAVLLAPKLPANIQIKVKTIRIIETYRLPFSIKKPNNSLNLKNTKKPTGKYKNHITAFEEALLLFNNPI